MIIQSWVSPLTSAELVCGVCSVVVWGDIDDDDDLFHDAEGWGIISSIRGFIRDIEETRMVAAEKKHQQRSKHI